MIDHLVDNLAYRGMVDDQIVSFNIQRKNYQADMSRAIKSTAWVQLSIFCLKARAMNVLL